jgi:phosphate starvation-inducible protein PhoH
MLTVKQYTELKNKINNFRSRLDRLSGKQDEIKKTLKIEFSVDNLEEAKELQIKLKKQYEKAESQFLENYEHFTEKWESVLNGE